MWTCSTCNLPISDCEQGILIAEDNLTGWRVVHHITCDTDRGPWHSLSCFVGHRGAKVFEGMRKQGAFKRLSQIELEQLRATVVRPGYKTSNVKRSTFRAWMRGQVNRADAIGDLAQDLAEDRRHQKPNPSLSDLYGWLQVSGASQAALETLIAAYREWQSYGNTYRASQPKPAPRAANAQRVKVPHRSPGDLTRRFRILKRDGYRCQLCGRTAADGVKLEIDHKIPRAKGGGDDESNLWVLCWPCNRGKRDELL